MVQIPLTWIVLIGFMVALTAASLAELDLDESKFVFGSAHEHASISIKIHDELYDMTLEKFQLTSPYIHLENHNGYVIHRHSEYVKLGFLFDSLNIGLNQDCITFDDGREFCTNEDYSLKFYINEKKIDDIRDYLIFDGDLILISYGDETQEEIDKQLKKLKDRGFPFQLRDEFDPFLKF